MSNDLIKIEINENQEQVVSARNLHKGLGINKDFTNWFKYQAEKLCLIEGLDFSPILASKNEGSGGHNKVDYVVTLDIGKHICMMSGGEKAHEIRNYFIQVEKAWNSPDQVMARALKIASKQIDGYKERLKLVERQIEADKPKVIFAEALEVSRNTILIGELAKLLKQNGIDVGQNRLFKLLRSQGYLGKKGEYYNLPTQRSMELGLFEIKTRTVNNPDGSVRTTKTTVVTGKGQIYFINKFKGYTPSATLELELMKK